MRWIIALTADTAFNGRGVASGSRDTASGGRDTASGGRDTASGGCGTASGGRIPADGRWPDELRPDELRPGRLRPDELWRGAFGDRPEASVVVGPHDSPQRRWLAAVVLGGRGRYGAAWALLEPMVCSRVVPDTVRAHAAITRASHLRQLGGHRQARHWDGVGLAAADTALGRGASGHASDRPAPDRHASDRHVPDRHAPGSGPAGGDSDVLGLDSAAARVDALLGLAADALGLAEFALAQGLLERVEPLALAHPSWRPKVRLDWIRAELALAVDEPGVALDCAERAAAVSTDAGASRHEVKSQLVRVVARSCVGEPPEKLYRSLEDLTERAISTRLCSLEWPIRLLLGQMAGPWDAGHTPSHRARYAQLLASIRQACDPIGRLVLDRSPWVAAAFGP